MCRILRVLASVAAAVSSAAAQSNQSATFEVASIKPDQAAGRIGIEFRPGGRLVATNLPLYVIIAMAYNLPFQSSRLSGGPEWIRAERFDIEAKAEKDAVPLGMPAEARKQKMRIMLQALLADRCKLTVHRYSKEMAVYAVTVAKDGPRLEKARIEEKDCPEARTAEGFSCHEFIGGQGRGLHGQAVDMADLALFVENWAEHPVIDRTGIKGLFHIETKPWLPIRPGPLPPAGAKGEDGSNLADLPTLFNVFTTMGLKLEAQKAPVEVFEITHVERPVEN